MRWAIGAALLVALVAAGAAAALLAPSAHTAPASALSVTYYDEAGDAGKAPDVRQLTIADDGAGNLSFAFVVTGFAPHVPGTVTDRVFVCLDTDLNWSTGSPGGGCDYAFAVDRSGTHQTPTFYTWNGTVLASQIDPAGVTLTGSGDTFSVAFSKSLIAGSSSFDFYVRSSELDGEQTLGAEYGPSHGWWRFPPSPSDPGTTTIAPPPPPALPPPVVGIPVTTGPPVAGRRFDAIFSVTGATAASAHVTAGGRAVSASARYAAGNEHVSLVVPRARAFTVRVTAGSFVRTSVFKVVAR